MLWLKNNMPASLFSQCMFFDLPDWLTYRATDDLARSNCSLACKCSYVPPGVEGSKGWNDEFFEQIGLGEFVRRSVPFLVLLPLYPSSRPPSLPRPRLPVATSSSSSHLLLLCPRTARTASLTRLLPQVKNDFIQVGGIPGKNGLILTAGQPVGAGLSKKAAEELGLLEGTAVGSAVIDACVPLLLLSFRFLLLALSRAPA